VLKAYALGLFSTALAVLVVAAVWIGVQPQREQGLLWGETVYTSKQEFNGYLKSKGLSYKTWLARNPGAAPWEPDRITVGAVTIRASTRVVQLLLAGIAWMLATLGALLLLRGERPGMTGFARGSVALFSAVLVGVLVAGIWFSTRSTEQPGLVWGGTVYTSKQEFNRYLKSKGLSYKTWVVRNPGAAPWEPAPVRVRTTARTAARATEAAEPAEARDWFGRPLFAAVGLVLTATAVLLLRRRRPAVARYSTGPAAFAGPVLPRLSRSSTVGPKLLALVGRVGFATSGVRGRLNASVPLHADRLARVAAGATGRLKASAPGYGRRFAVASRRFGVTLAASSRETGRLLLDAARATRQWLARVTREREISPSDIAFGVLATLTVLMFSVFVVLVLYM
jgi:hypothetical protein